LTAPAATAAKTARRQEQQAFKRAGIREAARAVFADSGLEGATVRAIASRAGYTPGAIYHHYAGKEEIYADLLAESLAQLHGAVRQAAETGPVQGRAGRAAGAFFDYYRANSDELYLGLYLYKGAAPRGLSAELDRQLNGRLIRVLSVIANALMAEHGMPPEAANRRTVALMASLTGLLILEASGRLKILGYEARDLLADAIADAARPSQL
jgi:AcrR family transcriptional regulator